MNAPLVELLDAVVALTIRLPNVPIFKLPPIPTPPLTTNAPNTLLVDAVELVIVVIPAILAVPPILAFTLIYAFPPIYVFPPIPAPPVTINAPDEVDVDDCRLLIFNNPSI